jgi:hypothetical protein
MIIEAWSETQSNETSAAISRRRSSSGSISGGSYAVDFAANPVAPRKF